MLGSRRRAHGWAGLLGGATVVAVLLLPSPAVAQGEADPDVASSDSASEADGDDRHRLFPLPFVFYQPETSWGGGAGLLHTYRLDPEARLSTSRLFLLYTRRHQYSGLLEAEVTTPGNRYVIVGELGGSHFPDLFYGIGNNTQIEDEEAYTLDQAQIAVELRRSFGENVQVGFSPVYRSTRIRDVEPDGALADGQFPGRDGGGVMAAGVVAVFDSRDDLLAPFTGVYAAARSRAYLRILGGKHRFTRHEVDARRYLTVRGGQVLALQALVTLQTGTPPFFELATLGGDEVLRGSYEGRYRARNRVVAQAEYRFPLWRRFGAVVFGGVGQVADRLSEVRPGELHVSGGTGLRFRLSSAERVNLRVDFGLANGESGVYFGLGEAF
jgi:hypothetical protein